MNTFTIYDLTTGEIDHSTTTVADINEVGLQEGQGIIEGSYQANEYIVVDGDIIVFRFNV